MDEITLSYEHAREFRFIGRFISDARHELSLDDGSIRKFHVEVYAIQDGGFVLALKYESTNPDEKSAVWIEDVDNLNDIEGLLYVIPGELVDLRAKSRENNEQRRKHWKIITQSYESMIFKFMDDLVEQVEQMGFKDRVKLPKPLKRKSFLKFLGR